MYVPYVILIKTMSGLDAITMRDRSSDKLAVEGSKEKSAIEGSRINISRDQ